MASPELPSHPPIHQEPEKKDALDHLHPLHAMSIRLRKWSSLHVSEISWALLFAVLAGYAFALYIEDAKPLKIYVVVDPDTDPETISKTFRTQEQKSSIAHIGRVPVAVQVELLADRDRETASRKADDLVKQQDTLLVIMHGRSDHVVHSLRHTWELALRFP